MYEDNQMDLWIATVAGLQTRRLQLQAMSPYAPASHGYVREYWELYGPQAQPTEDECFLGGEELAPGWWILADYRIDDASSVVFTDGNQIADAEDGEEPWNANPDLCETCGIKVKYNGYSTAIDDPAAEHGLRYVYFCRSHGPHAHPTTPNPTTEGATQS